ncbi:Paired amphipathic helix protein Sin3-like 6 [Carex littledalei]|uniref:Paired amphipathic helix protein Sin3-like 6 n=1 Tax=Carex littledalei TaxID=544730 RepID=A0A833RAN3_9POAL|nr:Paired amphipathic helix protein Sin3-like 6 [Carex littledalei]
MPWLEGVSEQKRSMEDALQKRIEKYRLFYQRIDDFIQDRIALDDVKEERCFIKGDEELPVQFKRLIYLYDGLETVPKFDPPVTPVDATDYVLKVQECYGDGTTKYKAFLDILTSFKKNNVSFLEAYYMIWFEFKVNLTR